MLKSVQPPPPAEDLRDKAQKFKDRKQQAKYEDVGGQVLPQKRVRHELLPKSKTSWSLTPK
jgi:hypothetical protein